MSIASPSFPGGREFSLSWGKPSLGIMELPMVLCVGLMQLRSLPPSHLLRGWQPALNAKAACVLIKSDPNRKQVQSSLILSNEASTWQI